MAGLMELRKPEEIAALRGLSIDQVLGLGGRKSDAVEVEQPAEGGVDAQTAEPVEA
jgi:small subunit ribosomal protein S5